MQRCSCFKMRAWWTAACSSLCFVQWLDGGQVRFLCSDVCASKFVHCGRRRARLFSLVNGLVAGKLVGSAAACVLMTMFSVTDLVSGCGGEGG